MNKPPIDHDATINAIRRILLEKWDPIGIGGNDNAADEYDSDIATIYRMIQERVGVEKLALQLGKIEKITMALSPHPQKNRAVAKLLLAIVDCDSARSGMLCRPLLDDMSSSGEKPACGACPTKLTIVGSHATQGQLTGH